MLPNGDKHSAFSVQNNLGGVIEISKRVVSAMKRHNSSSLVFGIETIGQYNRILHILNPKQIKKFKAAYPDLPKTDPVDAFVIVDSLHFRCITKAVHEPDYRYKALQTLTHSRFHLVKDLAQEK